MADDDVLFEDVYELCEVIGKYLQKGQDCKDGIFYPYEGSPFSLRDEMSKQLEIIGREQESLKSRPSGFLEACFLIGAQSSLLLLMLQDEKEEEQKLEWEAVERKIPAEGDCERENIPDELKVEKTQLVLENGEEEWMQDENDERQDWVFLSADGIVQATGRIHLQLLLASHRERELIKRSWKDVAM
ncbi:hypothetical protein TURU_069408 [Turdus rufiventris]|nr:hypothetical protein TURU_069408 [Turdus rufiventris]